MHDIALIFHDFPGLETGLPKFHNFPGPVVTLCFIVTDVNGGLNIPRFHRNTIGSQALSIAGPTVWNSLSDLL